MHRFRLWLSRHRIFSFTLGLFLTLWAIHELLNWRMERKWTAYCREARARGVKMTVSEIIPPEIPDEENFAATPLLRRMFGNTAPVPLGLPPNPPSLDHAVKGKAIDWFVWRAYFEKNLLLLQTSDSPPRDVLRALEKNEPQIAEWREAAKRPRCRLPLNYQEGEAIGWRHFSSLRKAEVLFGLRLRAQLAVGNSPAAVESFRDALQVSRALDGELGLVSAYTRMSVLSNTCSAIGDGLAGHQWTEPDLRVIEGELATFRVVREYRHALATERALVNQRFDQMASGSTIARRQTLKNFYAGRPAPRIEIVVPFLPRRLFRENQLRANQYIDEMLARVVADRESLDLEKATPSGIEETESFTKKLWFIPFLIFGVEYADNENEVLETQTAIDQTRIACALERHWLARGVYPESLAELVPAFLPDIPSDPYSNAALKYQRVGDSSFRLYSIGENRLDDGGVLVPGMSGWSQPDILWLYAPKTLAVP